MKKYKLELYGWEAEMVGHSLTDKQVKDIQMAISRYSECMGSYRRW